MHQVKVRHILEWIDEEAPFRYAEDWDNCGLQVGDPDAQVSRVLMALDVSSDTMDEAVELRCDLLVTHHPLILQPVRSIRCDDPVTSLVFRAIRRGIHILSAHTNLDSAVEGTNHHFAELMELQVLGPLQATAADPADARYSGLGLIGTLPREFQLHALGDQLRNILDLPAVRVVGDLNRSVRKVAVCTGSGASLLRKALEAGVQAFITGDVKYHDARSALEQGIAIVDVGHFASEKIVIQPWARKLREAARKNQWALEVFEARSETDPFRTITS